MTPTQVERNKAFVAALRVNPKKATGRMRDEDGGRCCLCVAYDVAQEMGAELPNLPRHGLGASLPPEGMCAWYGWSSVNPSLTDSDGDRHAASELNDGTGCASEKSHPELADLFEENVLR